MLDLKGKKVVGAGEIKVLRVYPKMSVKENFKFMFDEVRMQERFESHTMGVFNSARRGHRFVK